MTKRAVRRGALAAVVTLIVLVLIVLFVPIIAAQDLFQIGDAVKGFPDKCTMINKDGDPVELTEGGPENLEISRVLTPNADDALDVVALLKCQATLPPAGSAVTYSGNNFGSEVSCRIYVEQFTSYSPTTSWSQTISASGNATLTCQFKRTPPH